MGYRVSTHAPLAGSDDHGNDIHNGFGVSTHAPLAGSDFSGGARYRGRLVSTHAPLAGSDNAALGLLQQLIVSTHAPLAGSDPALHLLGRRFGVSTHAPLAGSDEHNLFHVLIKLKFQPTLPLRGATSARTRHSECLTCFNPRSPCGERLVFGASSSQPATFQPTLPLRGATTAPVLRRRADHVSTHAPLAGSDGAKSQSCRPVDGFNPRSPCGERLDSITREQVDEEGFNPRSPCGERLDDLRVRAGVGGVSTHAPLAGSDGVAPIRRGRSSGFQPTLPLRGATANVVEAAREFWVSTHAPLAGSDRSFSTRGTTTASFNPRSPCGERLPACCSTP